MFYFFNSIRLLLGGGDMYIFYWGVSLLKSKIENCRFCGWVKYDKIKKSYLVRLK